MEKSLLKQMLEEQYGTAFKGLVECENENLFLAQVCDAARKDTNMPDGIYTLDEWIAKDVMYSNLYNEFAHFYAGTTYGKSEEVCKDVEKYGKDKAFVEKMVKHAEHYLCQMKEMAA